MVTLTHSIISIKACEPLHRHYCNITTLLGQLQQSFQFFPPNMAVAQNLPLKSLLCKPGCGVFFGYFDVLLERKYRSAVIDSLTCARLCVFVVPSGLPLYQPKGFHAQFAQSCNLKLAVYTIQILVVTGMVLAKHIIMVPPNPMSLFIL